MIARSLGGKPIRHGVARVKRRLPPERLASLLHEERDSFAIARKRMVDEQLRARGISDPRVLDVMERLPRHIFVDEALHGQAYQDRPLQIGEGQTISQPYTVALMNQLLGLKGHERVLEIGSGCGYQTAVLAHLVKDVFAIERLKPLALKAVRRLKQLGLRNVTLRVGDGTLGWPEQAPFDAVTVAAVSPEIPLPYVSQLKEGGRLVIPTGPDHDQMLLLLEKNGDRLIELGRAPCRFVKLIGRYGH